jgi:Gamma tubulin complex component N-terminal
VRPSLRVYHQVCSSHRQTDIQTDRQTDKSRIESDCINSMAVLSTVLHFTEELCTALLTLTLYRITSHHSGRSHRWVLHGELHDSCKEFFVGCKSASSQPGNMSNMWLDTYYMRPAMLPTFLSRALAERALVIGKSINFIRLCIHKCPKSRSVKMKVRGQVCKYGAIPHLLPLHCSAHTNSD